MNRPMLVPAELVPLVRAGIALVPVVGPLLAEIFLAINAGDSDLAARRAYEAAQRVSAERVKRRLAFMRRGT